MSNPPPLYNADITCENCKHQQIRTFKARPGQRVVLKCFRCPAKLNIVIAS